MSFAHRETNRTSGPHFARNPKNCGQALLYILIRGGPRRNADPHRRSALPHSSTAPARAIFLHAAYHFARGFCIPKRHQHLIDDHIIQNLVSSFPQTRRESLRLSASPLNQFGQSRFPK
jgi:hypothetical protein